MESNFDSLVVGLGWLSVSVSRELFGWDPSSLAFGRRNVSWLPFSLNFGVPSVLERSFDARIFPSLDIVKLLLVSNFEYSSYLFKYYKICYTNCYWHYILPLLVLESDSSIVSDGDIIGSFSVGVDRAKRSPASNKLCRSATIVQVRKNSNSWHIKLISEAMILEVIKLLQIV